MEEILIKVGAQLLLEAGRAIIQAMFGKGEKKKQAREDVRHTRDRLRHARKARVSGIALPESPVEKETL